MNLSNIWVFFIDSEEIGKTSSSNRLGEIAQQVIFILQDEMVNISTDELADRVDVPKRRIYDVIAILKAANLVETLRDRNGTKVKWVAGKERSGKIWEFDTKKLRVKTNGKFTSVVNKGTEVVLESTEPYITIEDI